MLKYDRPRPCVLGHAGEVFPGRDGKKGEGMRYILGVNIVYGRT